jgi:hypothetical protein
VGCVQPGLGFWCQSRFATCTTTAEGRWHWEGRRSLTVLTEDDVLKREDGEDEWVGGRGTYNLDFERQASVWEQWHNCSLKPRNGGRW